MAGIESNIRSSNSAFSPAVCVLTLSGCQTLSQILRGGSFLLCQALSSGTHESIVQLDVEFWVHLEVCHTKKFPFSVVLLVLSSSWSRTPLVIPEISKSRSKIICISSVSSFRADPWCMAAPSELFFMFQTPEVSWSLLSACFLPI